MERNQWLGKNGRRHKFGHVGVYIESKCTGKHCITYEENFMSFTFNLTLFFDTAIKNRNAFEYHRRGEDSSVLL